MSDRSLLYEDIPWEGLVRELDPAELCMPTHS